MIFHPHHSMDEKSFFIQCWHKLVGCEYFACLYMSYYFLVYCAYILNEFFNYFCTRREIEVEIPKAIKFICSRHQHPFVIVVSVFWYLTFARTKNSWQDWSTCVWVGLIQEVQLNTITDGTRWTEHRSTWLMAWLVDWNLHKTQQVAVQQLKELMLQEQHSSSSIPSGWHPGKSGSESPFGTDGSQVNWPADSGLWAWAACPGVAWPGRGYDSEGPRIA